MTLGFNMTIWFNMTKQDYKPYRANFEGLNGLGTCFSHFLATKWGRNQMKPLFLDSQR